MKNTGKVHETIGKASQRIKGEIAAISQCQKCHEFMLCVS